MPNSYACAARGLKPIPSRSKPEPSKAKANFRSLFSENVCEGANVTIPRKVVETGKYGLTRIMINSKGFFFFQFKNSKGLEDVLENRPWVIRNSPIIQKKWTMNTRLCKDELTRILVWVKIHDVPIQGFSEDGLSIIVSQIGKPIMLDSYTSSMCIESWGRGSFARCLIEINDDDVLKESLTMGVPLIEGSRYTVEIVTIEYELKPPRCDLCKIFGHVHDHCPKKVSIPPTVVTSNVATPTVGKTNDGFQTVGKKKKKGKSKSTNGGQFGGHSIKQTVRYEPKATTSVPKKGPTNVGNESKLSSMSKTTITSTKKGNISTSNPYFALEDESDEDVENVYDESANLFKSIKTGESSSAFTAAAG
ncbi:zinc knuckle CX2CX4HX4C containing protein [Tanacetum coccineum]|uniref:Zinc knuckle CX2CX4HX4C containing protein n=1 Tax=Tanacetum coccineum TaxID=301880 RepID=A0ABQ4XPK3_9ASTR